MHNKQANKHAKIKWLYQQIDCKKERTSKNFQVNDRNLSNRIESDRNLNPKLCNILEFICRWQGTEQAPMRNTTAFKNIFYYIKNENKCLINRWYERLRYFLLSHATVKD